VRSQEPQNGFDEQVVGRDSHRTTVATAVIHA
jgi:hypothetical protein